MPFLKELEELHQKTPRLYNINIASENSAYCTHADKDKNCYLVFAANYCEDCFYGGVVVSCKDCTDCLYADSCELCYESINIEKSYNCDFCQEIKNCTDSKFCFDCIGCKNCFGCAGLRQKQFCFGNEQLTREEYARRVSEYKLKTQDDIQRGYGVLDAARTRIPHRALITINAENCIGNHIYNSKNCYLCFDTYESQDCAYLKDAFRTKDSSDLVFSDGSELCYESFSIGLGAYNCNFCNYVRSCSDCEYCELCFNCKNCFGCIGLQNKEFCILNKQYSKEEYNRRVEEIRAEMKVDGTYAKFHLPTTYRLADTAVAE